MKKESPFMSQQNPTTKLLAFLFLLLISVFGGWGSTLSGQSLLSDYIYFQSNNGIARADFSSGSPVFSKRAMNSGFEGIAAVADGSGDPLFSAYSVGVFRDSLNGGSGLIPLPSGAVPLFINASSTEFLFLPDPGNANHFYLIYNDQVCSALYFTKIDKTANGGLGGYVGSVNTVIDNSQNYSEAFEAIRIPGTANHFWILASSCTTDSLVRWTLDNTGIHSRTPIGHLPGNPTSGYDGRGAMSYCNGHLGLARTYTTNSYVGDFNPATGLFSNPVAIPTPGASFSAGAYGVTFSRSGNKAYFTDWYNSTGSDNLFIYDFVSGTQKDTAIATSGQGFGQAVLGPDNQIYIIQYSTPNVTRIVNPEARWDSLVFQTITMPWSGANLGLGVSQPVQGSGLITMNSYFRDTLCGAGPFWLVPDTSLANPQWDSLGINIGARDSLWVSDPGKYIVRDTLQDSISVNYLTQTFVVGNPNATISTTAWAVIPCDSVTLTAPAGYGGYQWEPAGLFPCPTCPTQTIPVCSTTTFYLTVEDSLSGCRDTDSLEIITAVTRAGFTWAQYYPSRVYFADSSVNADTWYWDFGDGNSSTDPNPVHDYLSLGTYWVCQTVEDTTLELSDTWCDSVRLVIIMNENGANANTFNISPNPSSGQINISYTVPAREQLEIRVLDPRGRLVIREQVEWFGSGKSQLNLGHLADGVYMLNISGNSGIFNEKIVIRK